MCGGRERERSATVVNKHVYTVVRSWHVCVARSTARHTAAHGVVSRRGGTCSLRVRVVLAARLDCRCARRTGHRRRGQVPGRARKAYSVWRARTERLLSVRGGGSQNGKQRGLGAAGRAGFFFQRRRGSFDGRGCAAPAAVAGQAAPWKTAAPGRMAAAAAQDHLKRILRKALRKSRLKMV